MRLARVTPFSPPCPVPRRGLLRVPCPGPPGSCSPVCSPRVWSCVYGVLGLLAPVHRCARPVCGVACTVSWASWLLLTGVHALCVVLRVRCPGPLGPCSPVCTLAVCCCVRGVLGCLAPVHRCACLGALCCVYGVLGPLAPVHRCARFVCGVVCAASWASWLLFTGARARCVLLAFFLSPSHILACTSACSPCLPSCFYLPPPSRPRGAPGVCIRVPVRSFGLSGVVEWWSGGVVEWWCGGVVEWWSGGVVVWWSGGVVEWWSG